MRLPLLAVALAAVAASAVPADAAYYPVCSVSLTPLDSSLSCTSGNTPINPTNRVVNVTVAAGTVQATVTCFGPYSSPTQTKVFSEGQRGQLSVREVGSCRTTLTALEAGTAAHALSYFTPRVVEDPRP